MRLATREMTTRFIVLGLALLSSNAALATSANGSCNEAKLRKEKVAIYVNDKSHQIWAAVHPLFGRFLASLKFREAGSSLEAVSKDSALKKLSLANAGPCQSSAQRESSETYSSKSNPYTVVGPNSCQKKLVSRLGLTRSNPAAENFGSMEAGILVRASWIEACTDGEKFVPCESLSSAEERSQSRACVQKVFQGAGDSKQVSAKDQEG